MSGSLNEIVADMLKHTMKNAAMLAVLLLHAMEERFGPEAREVMQDLVHNRHPDSRPQSRRTGS